jgi:hypothetical protein
MEKTSCQEKQRVTGGKKDRRVAEIIHKERPELDDLIPRPGLTRGWKRIKGGRAASTISPGLRQVFLFMKENHVELPQFPGDHQWT